FDGRRQVKATLLLQDFDHGCNGIRDGWLAWRVPANPTDRCISRPNSPRQRGLSGRLSTECLHQFLLPVESLQPRLCPSFPYLAAGDFERRPTLRERSRGVGHERPATLRKPPQGLPRNRRDSSAVALDPLSAAW